MVNIRLHCLIICSYLTAPNWSSVVSTTACKSFSVTKVSDLPSFYQWTKIRTACLLQHTSLPSVQLFRRFICLFSPFTFYDSRSTLPHIGHSSLACAFECAPVSTSGSGSGNQCTWLTPLFSFCLPSLYTSLETSCRTRRRCPDRAFAALCCRPYA